MAQQQSFEESLRQSNDTLEDYMDRCKSQSASIGNLRHQARHLESSLEVTRKALEIERYQTIIRQASVEELRTTAKQLEASLHFASDCLQDEKSRCNLHQASIASLTANVRDLEQSLHLANMDFEKHKLQNQDFIASTKANVQKLEKMLDLTHSDLSNKSMRCIAQAASIVGLNNKIRDLEEAYQASRGDLKRSEQRCNTQDLSIISLNKITQELEKSLQASREDHKAKSQLYSSQQPCIDSLKDSERQLQQSLQLSQGETEAEKKRCTAQRSLIAEMEKKSQELKIELQSTRGKLERTEQAGNNRDEGVSNFSLDMQQLEHGADSDTAELDSPAVTKNGPTPDDKPPQANTARKRYNNDDPELDSQRQTKRHQGTSTADAMVSTVSDTGRRQSNLAKETEAGKQQHVSAISNNVQYTVSAHDLPTPKKLASLERIRRSRWARDNSEGARHFVASLTPALSANVLSRLAKLSKSHSVQQVILQINLRQLDAMVDKLDGYSEVPPVVESGFAITEEHINRFSIFAFGTARMNKLVNYRLCRARCGPELDGKTLGFKPSGLLTLIHRTNAAFTVESLCTRFDAEAFANLHVTASERLGDEEATEVAFMDQCLRDIWDWKCAEPGVGSSTIQTRQFSSKQVDRSRINQIQTATAPDSDGGRGSERAKANHQPGNGSKEVHDKYLGTGNSRNAAATSRTQKIAKSNRKNKSSQGTAGTNGRPERTPKPSRRAAEAASARRG